MVSKGRRKPKGADEDEREVKELVVKFYMALNAMFAGDPELLEEIYSHEDDVTYMPAEGGLCVGWDQVYNDWKKQAALSLGAHAEPDNIQIAMGTGMATCQCCTKGNVKTRDGMTEDILLRESSVFRKENGKWKMIAHHADTNPLWKNVISKPKKRKK